MSLEDQRSCKCHTMKDGTIIYCDMHEAAPLLLEALKAVRKYRLQTHHGDDKCLKIIDKATAKAEGHK